MERKQGGKLPEKIGYTKYFEHDGALRAYANTWALGPLKPGKTAKFDWAVTAVKPGTHTIQYQVAAGLNGKSVAVLAGGGTPKGSFKVTVSHQPSRSYVNDAGAVVTTP